jgi:6-phosphogluconolactonase (cycloisomerase 2 family)
MRRSVLLAILGLATGAANAVVGCVSSDANGPPLEPGLDASFDVGPTVTYDATTLEDGGAKIDATAIDAPANDEDAGGADTGIPDASVRDAGVDASDGSSGPDASDAAVQDAGSDAVTDAGTSAPPDAGTDASTANDAQVEAGTDASATVDAGPVYTHFVYFEGAGVIEAFGVDETTGALVPYNETPDAGATYQLPTGVNALGAAISGSTLYFVSTAPAVGAYTINHGRLSRIDAQYDGGIDYPAGMGSRFVCATSSFVFTANETGNSISRFAIGAGGTLTPLGDVSLPTGAQPNGLILDPSGSFLFSLNHAISTITVFTIDGAGGLTAVDQNPLTVGQDDYPIATGAFLGTVHPTLRTIYVSAYSTSTKTTALAYDVHGILSPAGTPQVTGSNGNTNPLGFGLAVDPAGTHLYAVSYEDDAINIYAIDQTTGAITSVGTGAGPGELRGVSVDPSGKFLFAAGDIGQVLSYAISGDTLTQVVPATTGPSDGYALPVIVSP